MARFVLTSRNGEIHQLEGREGLSLMENIRDSGFDELLAMCGGCMACATCHVYVDELPEGAALPAMSRDESDLLDGAEQRRDNSRLSCQIPFTAALDGIAITIAPPE